jgi:hypothetical protein
MSEDMNIYQFGSKPDLDFGSQRSPYENRDMTTSKNMNKLWKYFHFTENYPEFYLGLAKKVANCRCLRTGKEEWFNGERFLSSNNPKKGSIANIEFRIKNITYERDFIFMGWVQVPVHEWLMEKGTTLQLDQSFVDGLLPKDKRYLGMTK